MIAAPTRGWQRNGLTCKCLCGVAAMVVLACVLTCVDVDAHAALIPQLWYVQHQDTLQDDYLGRVNLLNSGTHTYTHTSHQTSTFHYHCIYLHFVAGFRPSMHFLCDPSVLYRLAIELFPHIRPL